MIVSVTMTFSFIGGSSLNSPINRLQNAVSFNYFANTEVYDPRAQRVKIKEGLNNKKEQGKGTGEIVEGIFPVSESDINDTELSEGINSQNTNEINEVEQSLAEFELEQEAFEELTDYDNQLKTIGDIVLVGYEKFKGEGPLKLKFKFKGNENSNYELGGDFTANLSASDNFGTNINLGKIIAKPKDENSFILMSEDILGISESSDTNDKVVVNESSKNNINLEIFLYEDESKKLEDLISTDKFLAGSLKLKWAVGTTNSLNLIKE